MAANGALIAIAHPQDLAHFSSVLKGADVAIAAPALDPRFMEACRDRGAVRISAGLTAESARGYERVYTLSPLDLDRAHQDLAASLAAVHPQVLVPTPVPPFVKAALLDSAAFAEKLELLNEIYDPHGCELAARDVGAFEGYARILAPDVARARSLTHFDQVIEVEDTWSFERSAYERERYTATLSMIELAARHLELRRVIELGACEGLMTRAIAERLPNVQVVAVEPSERFAERLAARVRGLDNVELVRKNASEVLLDADLVVAAEVLYYAIDALPRMLRESRARAWVTSYHGDFEQQLAAMLERHSMHSLEDVTLPPRYERLLGGKKGGEDQDTPFLVRRVGCTIRLWLTSAN